jgi:penicillin-insensitive murein endopeptidase
MKLYSALFPSLSNPGVLLLVFGLASASSALANPWSKVAGPGIGPPQAMGQYTAGCLQGALPLPAKGTGYQVMRLRRQRYYAHPHLIAFLQELGQQAVARDLGVLLVGDLAQPRGGPMPSGHRSHQTGLDADIWFANLATVTRKNPPSSPLEPVSMLSGAEDRTLDPTLWSPSHVELLKTAAGFDEVARIFVHPLIKKELCAKVGEERGWLAKIRPWWGHDAHFHVRLRCPAQDRLCVDQEPLPPGDGCAEDLAWWFSEEAAQQTAGQPSPPPPLPSACAKVLQE